MSDNFNVLNRIELLRRERNLTLTALSQKVGINARSLSQYEKGKREPKLETWQALANFFNVSIPYLRGWMVCTRCGAYFIPNDDYYYVRDYIECCPYCMNPYFEGDKSCF